jgi:hypothetical protein
MSGYKAAPGKVPHTWSKHALLAKAQRYAEEMLNHDHDDWRFGFWSSLTLELLARAALSNVSPVLLAERKDQKDWHNLYFALGHAPKAKKFVPNSIGISEVFARISDILTDFDTRLSGFATLHMQRRNEEVHSGSTPFENIGNSDWLSLFYEALEILLGSMGEKLELLVGKNEARIARKIIAAAKDKSAKAVGKSIHAHKKSWDLLSPAERTKLVNQAALWASRQSGHRVKCPACNSDSLVAGLPVAPPNQKLKDDLIVVTQPFLPSKFECVACGLKIVGLPHLHACGLANVFTSTSVFDPTEFYAPFDEFEGYEDDNNEP